MKKVCKMCNSKKAVSNDWHYDPERGYIKKSVELNLADGTHDDISHFVGKISKKRTKRNMYSEKREVKDGRRY
jgi:hypothetical protein